MLIHIGDRTYDATASVREASLNDLYYLKMKTVDDAHPQGISAATLNEYLRRLGTIHSGAELLDDLQALMGLRGLVFLARRHAGEKLSVDEANDIQLAELRFESEDSDLVLEKSSRRPFRRGRPASALAAASHTEP